MTKIRAFLIGLILCLPSVAFAQADLGYIPSVTTTSALLVKSSQGNLYGFSITQGATAGFLAIINAPVIPAASATITPVECIPVAANAFISRRQNLPDRYPLGIVLLSTTSCTTYTANTPVLMNATWQ